MTPVQAEVARRIARAFLAVALAQNDTEAQSKKMLLGMAADGADLKKIVNLIAGARAGHTLAREALHEIANRKRLAGEFLLPELETYLVVHSPKFRSRRGRPVGTDFVRCAAIAGAVAALSEVNGFNRTRSRASVISGKANECACSVVADVLSERGLPETEQAVEKIYEKWRGMAAVLFFEGGVIPKLKSENKSAV